MVGLNLGNGLTPPTIYEGFALLVIPFRTLYALCVVQQWRPPLQSMLTHKSSVPSAKREL